RIEIDRKCAIALKREILRQMRRGGGFTRTALEVRYGNDLKMLAGLTPLYILLGLGRALARKMVAQCVNVGERVMTATTGAHLRLWPLSGDRQLAQIAIADADQLCGLTRGERAQRLHRRRREQPAAKRGELRRQKLRIRSNLDVSRLRFWLGDRHQHRSACLCEAGESSPTHLQYEFYAKKPKVTVWT